MQIIKLADNFRLTTYRAHLLRVRQIKSPLFNMKLSTVRQIEQAANYYAHFTKFSLL